MDEQSTRHRFARLVVAAVGFTLIVAVIDAVRSRRNPSACPYRARFTLALPRPFITRERLQRALEPRSSERILEVGPGTGYYTLDVAERIIPDGTLDVIDLQQEMLDHTEHRAADRGLSNLIPRQGNAQHLPYEDDTFDAAYLVAVLGEVPDQEAALRELHRVVKPNGRLVVGEALPDPHMIAFDSLRERATGVGFECDRRFGWAGGYVARLHVPV